jgi:carboxylesterase
MTGPAAPFSLGDGPDACLLLHGLTGSPAEVRPVGEALAQSGFRAVGPLLPGHGTTPQDLELVGGADLLAAARAHLLELRGARRIFLCGLSAGALLSIHLAARSFIRDGLPDFSGLALLAPAVEFRGSSWLFAQVVARLPALPILFGKGPRDIASPQQPDGRDRVDGSYAAVPMRWAGELRSLSREALRLAPRVHAPALILQGARDRTVAPSAARRLSRQLGSPRVEVRMLQRSGHVLPLDVEADEVCRSVVSFFQEVG